MERKKLLIEQEVNYSDIRMPSVGILKIKRAADRI